MAPTQTVASLPWQQLTRTLLPLSQHGDSPGALPGLPVTHSRTSPAAGGSSIPMWASPQVSRHPSASLPRTRQRCRLERKPVSNCRLSSLRPRSLTGTEIKPFYPQNYACYCSAESPQNPGSTRVLAEHCCLFQMPSSNNPCSPLRAAQALLSATPHLPL